MRFISFDLVSATFVCKPSLGLLSSEAMPLGQWPPTRAQADDTTIGGSRIAMLKTEHVHALFSDVYTPAPLAKSKILQNDIQALQLVDQQCYG